MDEFNTDPVEAQKPVPTFDVPEDDLRSMFVSPVEEPKEDLRSMFVTEPEGESDNLKSLFVTEVAKTSSTPNYQLLEDRLKKGKFLRSATTAMGSGAEGLSRNQDGTWSAPFMLPDVEGDGILSKVGTGLRAIGNFVGQKTGMRSDGLFQNPWHEEEINQTLYGFQKDFNLSDDEVKTAWSDMQAIYKPMDEQESLRTLSDGRILPNPANPAWLDKDLAEATILTSGGSEAEKQHYLANLDELQSNIALRQMEGFMMGNVSLAPGDMLFSGGENWESPIDWAKRTDRKFDPTSPEFVKAYRKDVIDKRSLIDAYQSDATLGVLKLANTIYGVGGLFGNEEAQEKASKGVEMTSLIRAGKKQTGIAGSIIEEVPSLAMQIGITIASGGIGSGLAGVAGATTATAARVGSIAGSVAAVGMSGVQSAGMTYGQLRNQGMSHEEAKSKSIDAGISTGIITGIFQAAGMGGAEAAIAKAAKTTLMRELYTSTGREALKIGTKAFLKSLPKSYFGEFTEEGLDEVVNSFLTSDPSTPIPTAWNDAIHAAFVGGAIGVSANIATGGFQKALELHGLTQTAEALKTNAVVAEPAAPSLAEARQQGIDISTLVPSEAGSPSVILKSKVNKKEGVSMERTGVKPTFLESIFGAPVGGMEYNEDFDRSSDFSLVEIPGTKLEAVVHSRNKVPRYLDSAYDHEAGKFVPLPPDVRAKLDADPKTKVLSKSYFENEATAEEVTDQDLDSLEEDLKEAPLVSTQESSLPNTSSETQREGQSETSASPSASSPTDQTETQWKGAIVEIPGYQTSNDAGGFQLREISDGVFMATDYTGRGFEITATELTDQRAKVIDQSPSPTGSLPDGQGLTSGDVGPPTLTENKQYETDQNTPKTDKQETANDQKAIEEKDDEEVLSEQPRQAAPRRPQRIGNDPELGTSGASTPVNYTSNGVRVHNQAELSKMVMLDDVELEGQGVDPETGSPGGAARPQTFYMDSHESETADGGDNENVTIGAMPVGALVLGKNAEGRADKAYRVVKTQPLKNGAVRHYLQPLFNQDTGKLDAEAVDMIYAAGVAYQARFGSIEEAAEGLIVAYLDEGKSMDSPEVKTQVRKMIEDAFGFLVGPGFTKDNVLFEAIDSPMHVVAVDGKPVIKVNVDKYVADLVGIANRIDKGRNHTIGMQQVVFDLVERLRINGLEELVHHQVYTDWGQNTENGIKLTVSVNQMLDNARSNDHVQAELARAARWVFGAETQGLTDPQVINFLDARRDAGEDAFNTDAWQIGHEMLASLYSRMKVGRDSASIRAAADRWVDRMSAGDVSQGRVLVHRLKELAMRYFEAIKDFFRAYESATQLPKELISLLRNLEDVMDKGFITPATPESVKAIQDFEQQLAQKQADLATLEQKGAQNSVGTFEKEVDSLKKEIGALRKKLNEAKAEADRTAVSGLRLPDSIGIQAEAVKQKMDVLDHPAVFAKDGYEYAQTQKQLREVVSAFRSTRNDQGWTPITVGPDGSLIVTDDTTPEEKSAIQPELDKLNANKRKDLTLRAMEAANDLNRMMTWINRASLIKKQKTTDDYGNPIEKTVSNFMQVLDQPLNAVKNAFGPRESVASILSSINEAIPKALQASLGITPEMLANPPDAVAHFESRLTKSDAVGTKLVKRVAEAKAKAEAAERAMEEFNSKEKPDTNENAAERRALAKKVGDTDKAYQDALIHRNRYIRKQAESVTAAPDPTLSKEERASLALNESKNKLLASALAEEDSYRAYRSALLAPENRPIQSLGELVSRRTSNPRLMDFSIRVAYPKGGVAETAIDEIQATSEIGGAVGRLMRFKDELNYMLMGGAKPKHMWSGFGFTEVGQQIGGRLVDFAVLPQLMKGRFQEEFLDVDAYDLSNQPAGVLQGRENFEFGNFSVRTDGSNQTLQAFATNLVEGRDVASSMFGIKSLATNVRDQDGRKMSGSGKTDLMSSNARFINNFLIQDMYEANRMGDHRIPTEVLNTMGFSLPYKQTESSMEGASVTRYPSYPDQLLNLPSKFDIQETVGERDFVKESFNLINDPAFAEVLREAIRFVNEATTPNPNRTPSAFFHASGLTPAGLAFQAVAPKLVEFLALTKNWRHEYGKKMFSPYDVLTQDEGVKQAYENLMDGLEQTEAIEKIRGEIQKSNAPYQITARFWELHRGMKIANSIFNQSRQAGEKSKSMTWFLKQADSKLPISMDALRSSSFVTNLLARSSKPSDKNTGTFISLLRPIRAQRGLELYRSIAPETDELVIRKQQSEGAQLSQDIVGANEGDVVSTAGDFALQNEKAMPMAQMYGYSENSDKGLNLIEQDRMQRQMRRERLEKWRSEMLLALLGGNPDAVIQYIHSERFMIEGVDESGNPTFAFDEEGIDLSIVEELERLQAEEIARGVVIDNRGRSYKDAVTALKARTTKPEHVAAIELIENNDTLVQKSVGVDTVQIEAAAFDADAYSMLTSVASTIPNLALIEGSASWQLVEGGPPAIVFIPDADAPTLIMPYGGKTKATDAELRTALAEMFLWSSRHGGADLVGNANRILDTLSFKGVMNTGMRKVVTEQIWRGVGKLDEEMAFDEIQKASNKVSLAMKDSGGLDKPTQEASLVALVETLTSNLVERRKNEAIRLMDTRLDERIGETVAGPIFLQTLTGGVPDSLTNEQAAAVIVSAMTDRSVQEALVLGIWFDPNGNAPTNDKLALRGNLLSPSLLPSLSERARIDTFGNLSESFKVTNAQGQRVNVGDENYESAFSDSIEDHLAGNLQTGADSATNTKGDVLTVGTIEQTEWVSKLLHQIMDQMEPRFEGQADLDMVEDGNMLFGTKSTVGKTAPKGLVVQAPPAGISEMEARQILSVMSEEHISHLVEAHAEGGKIASTQDLMALNRARAEVVRRAYNRVTTMEKGNRVSEDNLYNYGTFSYDTSLWSDNSRKNPYEQSRILKGAIVNGILDGGQTLMDEYGRDYIRLDVNLDTIMKLREERGHAIYVYAADGEEKVRGEDGRLTLKRWKAGERISREESLRLRETNQDLVIQDLEYGRRKYLEEVESYKQAIQKLQDDAIQAGETYASAKSGIEEVEAFFNELNEAEDQQQKNDLLKGKDFMEIGQGFMDAPQIIKAAFDTPQELASAVTDNILDLFRDGVREIPEVLSYVPPSWSKTPGQIPSKFGAPANETPAQKTERKRLLREEQAASAKRIEALNVQKAAVTAKYKKQVDGLRDQIDTLTREVSRAGKNQKTSAAAKWSEKTGMPGTIFTEGDANLLTSEKEQQIAALREAIDQAGVERDQALANLTLEQSLKEGMVSSLGKTPETTDPVALSQEARAETFLGMVKTSATQQAFGLVSRRATAELRRVASKSALVRILSELSDTTETVPVNDLEVDQSQITTAERKMVSFDAHARAHNRLASEVVNQVNNRIPGLLNPDLFEITSPDDAMSAYERFGTLLTTLQTPSDFHYLLKAQRAREAILSASLADLAFNDRIDPTRAQEAITSFDQIMSKGKGMLDSSDRIKISREAAIQIRGLLIAPEIDRGAIERIVQEDLFPFDSAAEIARTQLLARMKEVLAQSDNMVGAALAMDAIRIAKETKAFNKLPQSLEYAIIKDIATSLSKERSSEANHNVRAILKKKAEMQASYAYRRNTVSAPRSNFASRMEYDGNRDSIEILRQNHLNRGLDWSRNYMASKKTVVGPNGQVYDQTDIDGMEDALDRMSKADQLAFTASVISEIESKTYDVVGNLLAPTGTLKPDGTPVRPLATSGYSLANTVSPQFNTDDSDAVRAAKDSYALLMKNPFFGKLKKGKMADSLTDQFDPEVKLKETILRMLINVHNAARHEGFDNLGNHPFTDFNGTAQVKENLKERIGPILSRIDANSTAAQIKDLVDIHNEIVAEVLAARTAHDIALGIVDGTRMDAGLINRYLLNHDPSVRKAFAGNAKGRQGAIDALGFIGFGATGHTGRNGYASAKNAWSNLFTAEEKKLKGPNKFEDAAAGVMFFRVVDYLSATGKTYQERAQTLIEMFEQADDGYAAALSANSTVRIKGNRMQDILKWPMEKLNDIKGDLTEDTFEMLRQRKVYEQLRDFWVPQLQMMKDGQRSFDDLYDDSWKSMSKQAQDWGKFVRNSMEHISQTLQVSAMMNGIEPENFSQNRSMTPFRWRVFGREHQSTEQFPDYGDVLAIDRASYRQSPTRKPKPGEIHMLDISGFTGPLHVIDDALHRMMMVDAYAAFKNFAGVSVTTDKNKRTLTTMGSLYHHGQRIKNDEDKVLAHAASARLASLGQDIIHKDVFTVTNKSMLMDGVQQIARHGAVKALLSLKQIYAQVAPGLMAYSFIREGMKGNKDFPALFSKIVYSMVAGRLTRNSDTRMLGDNVDTFALINGPLVYRRTAGGEEEYHKAISKVLPSAQNRSSRTFGDSSRISRGVFYAPNKVKQGAGVVVDVSEKMLHYAIATPESAFARSVFAHQVWKMVNESLPAGQKVSFEDLMDPIKGKEYNITPQMKQRAEIMVNDMIASTDRAKKAELLQQSPDALSELFRGAFATFANHPLHTWGNTRAAISMMRHGDEESRIDGRRLATSNIFQNVLFQLTRIELLTQVVGYSAPLIAAAFTDLDEEERDEMRKRIVGSIYGINADGSRKDGMAGAMRYLAMALGSSSPMGYKDSEGWSEKDMKSDMTNLAGRVLQEGLVQVVPGAATTLGSKGLEKLIEAVVKKTMDPEGKFTFDRAGMVVGDGLQGNAMERSIYNTTKTYRKYLSDLSYFTIGLDSVIDPLTRMSNVDGDLNPLEAPLMFASEAPFIPRDFRTAIEKKVDEEANVKRWSFFWEKAAKPTALGF